MKITLLFCIIWLNDVLSYFPYVFRAKRLCPRMALDDFMTLKLNSIVQHFDVLTERLADPDLANDRKQMLDVSRERSSMEKTVEAYNSWKDLDVERLSLVEMDQSADGDQDLRELVRAELRELLVKQVDLEKSIAIMLLPRDPNDDRNVMLEIRSGTGGDEAGIWAGDLVGIYRKYCEMQGWKVIPITESAGDMGGFKTCILQITGDFVYSKMKYEVGAMNIYCITLD